METRKANISDYTALASAALDYCRNEARKAGANQQFAKADGYWSMAADVEDAIRSCDAGRMVSVLNTNFGTRSEVAEIWRAFHPTSYAKCTDGRGVLVKNC